MEKVEGNKSARPEYKALLDCWSQYKRLARTDQWINWVEPILNRVSPALSEPRIRTILSPSANNLDLADCILSKKVVLLQIPQKTFHQSGTLLGSLLVTGVKHAAETIRDKKGNQGHSVALYIDGLDNLIDNETVTSITDDTSRCNIGLIASTRHLAMFGKALIATPSMPAGADSWNRMLTCFGSVAVFAVDKSDAELLAPQIFPFDSKTTTPNHRCTSG